MCMTTTAARSLAKTATMCGSPSPWTSFTMSARRARALAAISGLYVSIEIRASVLGRSAFRTGSTRRHSSSAETGSAPGRVDSPPTSRISAPSSARWTACATALAGSANRPPSEKESGVTLTMPLTAVWSKVSSPALNLRTRASICGRAGWRVINLAHPEYQCRTNGYEEPRPWVSLMVPGSAEPSIHDNLDLREHDRDVLEFLTQDPSSQVAFQGIRRRLGIHPEQLSRALHRLADDGLVEHTEHGYRATAKALTVLGPDALTRTPEGLTVLETYLPARVEVRSLVDALQGRWFGPLRWFGFSEDQGELRLWWSTEDNGIQLEVRLHESQLRIVAHMASGNRLDEAARHAYLLFEHLSREVSRGLYSGLIS